LVLIGNSSDLVRLVVDVDVDIEGLFDGVPFSIISKVLDV